MLLERRRRLLLLQLRLHNAWKPQACQVIGEERLVDVGDRRNGCCAVEGIEIEARRRGGRRLRGGVEGVRQTLKGRERICSTATRL